MTNLRTRFAHLRSFVLLSLFVWTLVGFDPSMASAQASTQVTGVVIDETSSMIPGARVSVSDAKGAIVQVSSTDSEGGFSIRGLAPGAYTVRVELNLFAPATEIFTIGAGGAAPSLRITLKPGGLAEKVIVTAQRVETRLAETPQKVEVVDGTDIERSVASDLTDVLKKNAGVDVIQYNSVLSGIGIRGFRPQTSGLNKRSLLLVDGRPSGVTNLATLTLGDIDHIEVLKGAASAIYGSSAMGGVVNVITRRSAGRIGGAARLGAASFGGSNLAGRVGGRLTSRIDFDATGESVDQRHDYRMGNGAVRPATTYNTYNGSARVGIDLLGGWRLEGRGSGYHGRDIMTPPDIVAGTVGQGRKNLEQSAQDGRLTGRFHGHNLTFVGYHAAETSHISNVTTSNPADIGFLPYLSFESESKWAGLQVRDAWRWSSRGDLVIGLDVEHVTAVTRSYNRTGARVAPFSADGRKRTIGVYAEHTLRLFDGRTILDAGGRLDRVATATLATPLKTNFTASETTFNVFNPSFGVKQELMPGLRGHFAIGRAFIPAEASMLTGFTTTVIGGRTQITQGNPDLKPERSTSFDGGVEWTAAKLRIDVTAFRTAVKDRFISNVTIRNPPPPDPIVVSIVNGLDAHISGLDLDAEQRVGPYVGVFATVTHYFNRRERLLSGAEQDILNVALNTVRAGIDVDFGRISARLSGRYVHGRKDNDFNTAGFPIVNYDNFTVVDATMTYRLVRQHVVELGVNNLFDAFYYEKLGYPLQGASFRASYRFRF